MSSLWRSHLLCGRRASEICLWRLRLLDGRHAGVVSRLCFRFVYFFYLFFFVSVITVEDTSMKDGCFVVVHVVLWFLWFLVSLILVKAG